jgi:hypothetical protein
MTDTSAQREFPRLNLPQASLRLKEEEGKLKVFDPLRKKFVALTPEEYVRQNFTAWLIGSLRYPAALMSNEVALNLNGLYRRCDTLIFNRRGKPFMIVEYKAPEVEITQKVFDQIVRYNMVLQADYIVVSNGLRHFCCRIDYSNSTYHFTPNIPDYQEE